MTHAVFCRSSRSVFCLLGVFEEKGGGEVRSPAREQLCVLTQ